MWFVTKLKGYTTKAMWTNEEQEARLKVCIQGLE